jgi:hypothetical protein
VDPPAPEFDEQQDVERPDPASLLETTGMSQPRKGADKGACRHRTGPILARFEHESAV